MITREIREYIEKHILPVYNFLDKAHGIDHIRKVIDNSLEIARDYDVDRDMVYIIAAFHDIGMIKGRENHHIDSGRIIMEDKFLKGIYSLKDRTLMKEAVEDHRASNNYEPRSIYGKIVSEGDRDLDYYTILKRTIEFGLVSDKDIKMEEHYLRSREHIIDKYGENGYINLWLDTNKNRENLKIIREKLNDEKELRRDFELIYENLLGF